MQPAVHIGCRERVRGAKVSQRWEFEVPISALYCFRIDIELDDSFQNGVPCINHSSQWVAQQHPWTPDNSSRKATAIQGGALRGKVSQCPQIPSNAF